MHRLAAVGLALAIFAGGRSASAQTIDDLFDDSYVHEIRLVLRSSDWNTLRARYLFNDYYPAEARWKFKGQDIVIRDCAIRSRGRGSRSGVKPNLRVDVNRDAPGQTFLGLKSFVLNASNQDASMLAEKTAFKLWERTGLPAPREAYTRLYVNDVFWGVYLIEEEIREEFIEPRLNDTGGDLYEWKPIENTPDGVYRGYHWEWTPNCRDSTSIACSTDPNRWNPVPWDPEENKKTFDLGPTINLHRMPTVASDAEFDAAVSAMLDLRLFMFHIAIENYIGDYDSFLYSPFGVNNVWIYRFKGTPFHQFIVWDKNGAFEGGAVPLFFKTETNVLVRRTLAVPAHRREYIESAYKMAVLSGGPGGWLAAEHQRNYDLAAGAIREDPNKQYDDVGVLKPSSNEQFEARATANREFIDGRQAFVLSELQTAGIQLPANVSIAAGGVVNAATNQAGAVAPGSVVSLYGFGFSQDVIAAPGTSGWPKTLGGITVYVNGFEAPLQFVSPTQLNLQIPWEVGLGNGNAPFTVMLRGASMRGVRPGSPVSGTFTNTVTAPIGVYSPGIYAIAHLDGTPVAARPVRAGDILVIYANGLGPVSNRPASGGISSSTPLSETAQAPSVTIGGQPARVLFSGLAPDYVGAYQVNVQAPSGVTPGSAAVLVSAGTERSQPYIVTFQ